MMSSRPSTRHFLSSYRQNTTMMPNDGNQGYAIEHLPHARGATPLTPDVVRAVSQATNRAISRNVNGCHGQVNGYYDDGGRESPHLERLNLAGEGSRSDSLFDKPNAGGGGAATERYGRPRNYYNNVRNQVYTRFSPNDWMSCNVSNFNLSEKERQEGAKIRADAWRTIRLTDQKTAYRQEQAREKLKKRISLVTKWKDELCKEAALNADDDKITAESISALEISYGNTMKPLSISEQCLVAREGRQGIDLVIDDVEKALSKEVKTIKTCRSRMHKLLDISKVQLRLLKAARCDIEKAANDMRHAIQIDDRMHQLNNSSHEIALHPGIENIDNTTTTPETWMKYAQELIARSMKCRGRCEQLRQQIDSLQRQCANEMWTIFNSVNNAFNVRVNETAAARNKLQGHLKRTNIEISEVDKSLSLIWEAIQAKDAPLKVAQTRLDERTRRQNLEICFDPAMRTLQNEVNELRESIRMLKDKLRLAEGQMARLCKAKNVLENDIMVKQNSIDIDQGTCLGMRKAFPMDPKGAGVFNMPLTY